MAVLLITVNKQNYHDMFTAFTVNEFTELVFTVNPLIDLSRDEKLDGFLSF